MPRSSSMILSHYESALHRRGLASTDAGVLAAWASGQSAPYGAKETLLSFIEQRLSPAEWKPVVAAVVEVQARGPSSEPWAAAWRVCYENGCPIDHIWRVLWHSFKDPEADPQDHIWLEPAEGLDNLRRVLELGFPRSQAPEVYGPGLGCEILVHNASVGVRELRRLDAPDQVQLDSLRRCWEVLSPNLRAELERRTDVKVFREPDGPAASAEPEFKVSGPGCRDPVELWFDALDELLAQGQAVVDLSRDRYRLSSEPAGTVKRSRRKSPARPRSSPPRLRTLVSRWGQRHPPYGDPSLETVVTVADLERGSYDPIRWLRDVAEMAAFLDYDWESGRPRIREPLAAKRGRGLVSRFRRPREAA